MTDQNNGPFNLGKSPIHLGNTGTAVQHGFGFDGPAFEAYVNAHSTEAEPGRLAMIEESPEDWGAWECHNCGDELVIVLAGTGTFIQEIDGKEVSMPFGPGDAVVNPAGVWHTANITTAMRAIYLTPCYGTEHRPR